jgi:hypothetical protein
VDGENESEEADDEEGLVKKERFEDEARDEELEVDADEEEDKKEESMTLSVYDGLGREVRRGYHLKGES